MEAEEYRYRGFVARLFVAVEIPEDVKAHISAQIAPLKEKFALQWSPPRNWHLTLAFLGDAEPAVVAEALRTISPRGRFELELYGWGCFPKAASARVLWAGISENEGLNDLVAEVRQACRPVAPSMDLRPFTGHITLARSRNGSDLRSLPLKLESLNWRVNQFVLIESRLGANPPYRTIESYPL